MTHRLCLSCENSVPTDAEKGDKILRIIQNGNTLAILCEECQGQVKSFRMGFSKETPDGKWEPMNFQCLGTFHEEERKEYYDKLDITRAQE